MVERFVYTEDVGSSTLSTRTNIVLDIKMFEAFILVCSASIAMEVDSTNCILIKDTWGPYSTQEACNARTLQMVSDIVYGELSPTVNNALRYPPVLYTEERCTLTKDDYI